jgi:hypothetical protein
MKVAVRTTWTREDGKVFPVFITEAAFDEWLRNRDHLKKRGVYPDRPPDVDTETTRQWQPHPGEEGYARERLRQAEDSGSIADKLILTKTMNLGGLVFKLFIHSLKGRVRYRIDFMDEESGQQAELESDAETTDRAGRTAAEIRAWGEQRYQQITEKAIARAARFGVEPSPVMVTTAADFDRSRAQSKAIHEAIEKWYGVKVERISDDRATD